MSQYFCQYRGCETPVGAVAATATMNQTSIVRCPAHFIEVIQERRKADARRKLYDGVSEYPKLQEALDTAWNTLDAQTGRNRSI